MLLDVIVQPVLVGDVQLVIKLLAPEGVLRQVSQRRRVRTLQKLFRHVQALQFVHGFYLLLSFHAGYVQGLVFSFDAFDLTFDFLFPFFVFNLLSIFAFVFKVSDFF